MTQQKLRDRFSGGHLGDALDYKRRLNTLADTLFQRVQTIAASRTMTEADSNGIFLVGTDALTITLPATALGLKYTFINSGADGTVALTVAPNAKDKIMGTIANAAADSVSGGVDNKYIRNTKTTANKGDRITLVADGADGWYIVDGVGIWASES